MEPAESHNQQTGPLVGPGRSDRPTNADCVRTGWVESPLSGEHIKVYEAPVPADIQAAITRNLEEGRWRANHPAQSRSGWSIFQDVMTCWFAAVGFLIMIGGFIWYLAVRK